MIGQKLIDWYQTNKRDLPWRETQNPYFIWVSEVILQQTRVNQGLSYYYRFITAFPDVFTLANADVDHVLKVWQGLGYYSRARNMYTAARDIVSRYEGKFPTTYRELITIKGIGDYTASAIASISFGQAVPVIDGNVNRVIARLFGITEPINKASGQKLIRAHAEALIEKSSPDIYNQAIMEFGALQCSPNKPNCTHCILMTWCVAYKRNLVENLPIKANTVKTKVRYFHYLVISCRNHTIIHQRMSEDIWKGLYEFPMIETEKKCNYEELQQSAQWKFLFGVQHPLIIRTLPEICHKLTHRTLKVYFHELDIGSFLNIPKEFVDIPWSEIHQYAVPKVIDNYLAKKL